ncbi:MAG: LPS export ABC transporter permease LptG [Formosimonas sp.]
MKLIVRVFYKELLWSIVAVLLGFLMLFVTIDGFSEARRVGSLDYTYTTLLSIILLKVPEYVYQLLPICALIGSVLAWSNLAARSEMVVWRVSGLSLASLLRITMALGVVLAVVVWLLGDIGIASAQRRAKEIADTALHRTAFFKKDGGYWSRQNLPDGGTRMINVRNVTGGATLERVNLYELTPQFALNRLIEAKTATEQPKAGVWLLREVRLIETYPDEKGLVSNSKEVLLPELEVDLAENTLTVIRNSDELSSNLTMPQLQERIETMSETGQNPREYQVAYWQKFFYPLGIMIMMLLALPFAFMQTRKGGVGVRVFTGIMLGLLFFILTVMTQAVGGLVTYSPILLAGAPSALFLLIALVWIYRVARV